MKRILLFVFCILSWSQSFSQTDIILSPEEEKISWELLKRKYLSHTVEDYYKPAIFRSSIKVGIKNSDKPVNKRILKEIIDSIQPYIGQKISFTSNVEESNFVFEFITQCDKTTALWDYPEFDHESNDKLATIKKQNIKVWLADSVSDQLRKKAFQYKFINGLIKSNTGPYMVEGRNYTPDTIDVSNVNFIFHSVLNNEMSSITLLEINKLEFNKLDKFVLSKLYSQDFHTDFRKYLFSEYSFIYSCLFFYPKLLETVGVIINLILCVVLGLFLINNILKKSYRFTFLSYIIPGLYIWVSFAMMILITSFFQGDFIFKADQTSFYDFQLFILLYSVTASVLIYLFEIKLLAGSKTIQERVFRMFFITMVCLIAAQLLVSLILKDDEINQGSILMIFTLALIRVSYFYLIYRKDAIIKEKDLQLSSLSASKAEAEVASLHARINPHFLYNSLNSIAGLAHIDADKTEKMALSLSDLFRHNLNRKNEAFCTIEDEVEAAIAYMNIEQIRFGEQLQFNTELDESLYNYLIPRNIIQPLLENAIKHGISKLNKPGKIKLSIIQNQNQVEISVFDNGPDFKEGSISGYGLQSIFDILKLTYNNEATLNWEDTPEKRVWISIDETVLIKK